MIAALYIASMLSILAGVLHGGREAQHAQPKVFELRFGVSSKSFFGSLSWVRKYEGFDAKNKERKWLTSFSDYWHVAAWGQKLCIIAAVLIATCPDACRPYWWAIGAGVSILESMAASVAYKYLRYGELI